MLVLSAGCGKVGVSENGTAHSANAPDDAHGQLSESVTLSWNPPTEYTDGSYLHDLAGYRIYTGPTVDDLEARETVYNPGLSSYVIEPVEDHELYFAMTALSADGAESALSEAVTAPDG